MEDTEQVFAECMIELYNLKPSKEDDFKTLITVLCNHPKFSFRSKEALLKECGITSDEFDRVLQKSRSEFILKKNTDGSDLYAARVKIIGLEFAVVNLAYELYS